MAVLAATLAGLVAVLVAVLLRRPAPAPPTPPQLHRVELQLPPVEAALWFAARYPRYFTSGERGLEPWLAELDPREQEFVLAMAQTLTWTWVELELARMPTRSSPVELARAVIGVVRGKTLNQLELALEPLGQAEGMELVAYVGDPRFADGVFARLIRGGSNCEGQNHLAALLLETALAPALPGLPEPDVQLVGIPSGHELVRVDRAEFGQPMFVDPWSNLPPFVVDEARPGPAPHARAYVSDRPAQVSGMRGRALAELDEYAQAKGVHVSLVPELDAPTMPVDLHMRAPALDARSLARRDPWQLFLFARVLHVYDDPRATELYQWVLDHHCEGLESQRIYVCVAARLLLPRASVLSVPAP